MKKTVSHTARRKSGKYFLIVSNDGLARGLMAFAYMKKRLREMKLTRLIRLAVAPLMASEGLKPDPWAVKKLAENRVPLNGFRVQPLGEKLLEKADRVITLSYENQNYLRNSYRTVAPLTRILDVPSIRIGKQGDYEKAWIKIREGLEEEILSWAGEV